MRKSPVRVHRAFPLSGLSFKRALFGGSHDFQRLMDMLVGRQAVGRRREGRQDLAVLADHKRHALDKGVVDVGLVHILGTGPRRADFRG